MNKVVKNFLYILRQSWKKDKSFGFVVFMEAILRAGLPFILLYLSKDFIDGLTDDLTVRENTIIVIKYSILYLLLFLGREIAGWIRTLKTMKAYDHFSLELSKKAADIDFEQMEDAATLNMFSKANDSIWFGTIGVYAAMISLLNIVIQLSGFIYIFSRINPWFFLSFLPIAMIHLMADKKRNKFTNSIYHDSVLYKRRADYIADTVIKPDKNKDIRIYNGISKLMGKLSENQSIYIKLNNKINLCNMWQEILDSVLYVGLRLCIYLYFIVQFLNGSITLGDFSMLIIATETLYRLLVGIPESFLEFWKYSIRIEDYVLFMNMPLPIQSSGAEKIKDLPAPEIKFENVSFRYPNSNQYAVENVTFTIPYGEKLIIAGDNGSGKSTIIKLLLRLYNPTSGRILIDSKDIADYDYHEYMTLFGVMFQDYRIFEYSIKENITLKNSQDGMEDAQVYELLRLCGLDKKVLSLTNKADSSVFRNYDENGVMLSGGEQQKLAVARVLYQNRPIEIYDEPAAAMDPEAEMKLYSLLSDISKGKTVISVSHRMSTCVHADRIILLNCGKLEAIGSHDILINKCSLYKTMWQAQASYYGQN